MACFKIPASMISGMPTEADLAPPKPVKKAVAKPAPRPLGEGPTGDPARDFGIRPEDAP
jgi:hypothetical protein